MDITFVISHIPNPRMNKRIEVAKNLGETSLVCWDRETVKIWDIAHTDIKNIKINVRADYTSPLRRIFPTMKFIYKALKEINQLNPKCLYVANIDMLLVAYLHSFTRKNKPHIVYEIADLNSLVIDNSGSFLKRFIKWGLISVEKHLCKKIDTLVVTSEKFFEIYYSKFVPRSKALFIPNIPDLSAFKNYSKKKRGGFTIGFVGVVRYKEQMKMLIEAAEKCNINLLFAGGGIDDEIETLCRGKAFIEYCGKYDYNSEIANLYEKMDCVYSVYDTNKKNVQIALPNKLYESIYCELPIIVAKGTYLAEKVEEMGVGIAVSPTDVNKLINELKRLSKDEEYYNNFVKACAANKKDISMKEYNKKLRITLERFMG